MVAVDGAALPFGNRGDFQLCNNVFEGGGRGPDRARQREAAQRAEADDFLALDFAGQQFEARIGSHDQHAVALDDQALFGEIERHDRYILGLDVAPDIDFGPVRQRKDPDALALADLAVIDVPEFRALIARIPAMVRRAEGIDAFLGARGLFVAARATESGVELAGVERVAQRFRLHDVGIERRAVGEWRDVLRPRRAD